MKHLTSSEERSMIMEYANSDRDIHSIYLDILYRDIISESSEIEVILGMIESLREHT